MTVQEVEQLIGRARRLLRRQRHLRKSFPEIEETLMQRIAALESFRRYLIIECTPRDRHRWYTVKPKWDYDWGSPW